MLGKKSGTGTKHWHKNLSDGDTWTTATILQSLITSRPGNTVDHTRPSSSVPSVTDATIGAGPLMWQPISHSMTATGHCVTHVEWIRNSRPTHSCSHGVGHLSSAWIRGQGQGRGHSTQYTVHSIHVAVRRGYWDLLWRRMLNLPGRMSFPGVSCFVFYVRFRHYFCEDRVKGIVQPPNNFFLYCRLLNPCKLEFMDIF